MAERVGFEPTPPFPTLSVFKTELFNRLSTFPSGVSSENRTQDKQSHNLPRCHFANDTMMTRRGTAVMSCLGPAPKKGEKRTFPLTDTVAIKVAASEVLPFWRHGGGGWTRTNGTGVKVPCLDRLTTPLCYSPWRRVIKPSWIQPVGQSMKAENSSCKGTLLCHVEMIFRFRRSCSPWKRWCGRRDSNPHALAGGRF